MGHWKPNFILFSLVFTACLCCSNGCTVVYDPGVQVGGFPHAWILDTFRGNFWQNETTGIAGINTASTGSRPYYSIDVIDSRFVLSTTDLYEQYEEYEVTEMMLITATFRCADGSNSPSFSVWVNVRDTNNNAPTFLPPPSGDFVFTIAAPVPPGYEVTGCSNDMIVRDIDLTTEKITFEIEENPYFEIEREILANSASPKEFSAIIRTKTFIRSIPEPIRLTISATDHDRTDDDPITTTQTIYIIGNSEFELPEEPVFSKTLYHADYTEDNRVVLTEPITLQSGYDELVKFDIIGDFPSGNFELESNPDQPNQLSIRVVTPLEGDVLKESNIHLIVTAVREHTSGASATVVLRLPEVVPLEFQSAHYEGTIEDNNLRVPQLILSQGYEGATVYATVGNEYFTATVQMNTVTLSMRSLDESIIEENSFLNLEVSATNGLSTATTVVTLEIIKDDNVTPVFNKAIYTGSYEPDSLVLEQIVLVQGHEGIDAVDLDGDYQDYFRAELTGTTVTIQVLTIPPEMYSIERIVLSLVVRKPRTVGASAAIIINLPAARELRFGASTHRGSLQNNVLTLDPISLTVGFDSTVVFSITGEYEDYFEVTSGQNPAIITLNTEIPGAVLLQNNIIILTLTASGPNAVTTTTSVLLDVIKDDIATPTFSRNIYHGTYLGPTQVNIDDINLSQGFDSGVTFRLDGEHAQYFGIEEGNGNNVVVVPRLPIPEDIIFQEKVLVFNVLAEKALTVGANAAISINFPSDLTERAIIRFSKNTYTGALGSTGLEAESIVLSLGYEPGTQFILTGEFDDYFTLTPNDANVLSLLLTRPLPIAATENAFIVLEIEARRANAVSGWTSVVIELIRQDIVAPVFTQAYYRGAYNAESGLEFDEVISLSYGYDETVSFALDGEFREMFTLDHRMSNSLGLVASELLSNEVLQANNQVLLTVVATKPGTLAARSAISIDIEKDITEKVIMRFSQNTYTGTIGSTGLEAESIVLSSGYEPGTEFILTGEFDDYFTLTPNDANVLSLLLTRPLPIAATENAFIVLEIEARRANAVSGWTSVVIELFRQDIVAPVFTQAYYRGAYNAESGLQFDEVISLSYGYDETVSFSLDGEFREMFTLEQRGSNSLGLVASESLSNDVLQANNHFLLTVVATKPGALAARSAISIDIEKDLTDRVIMRFSQNTYTGAIGSTGLEAESIVLSLGYEPGTQFILTGEFDDYFTLTPNDANVLSLLLTRPLPIAATENAFIVLEVEARRANAVSGWTSVVIEVIRQDIVAPVFTQAYYRGAYNAESGLQFDEVISLSYGYDETVSFALDGEFREMFTLDQRMSNSLGLVASESLSNEALQANNQVLLTVVATKPGALAARSAISIDIEKDLTDRVIMRFSQNTYTGAIGSTGLEAESIVLSLGYEPGTQFILTGEFDDYFTLTPNDANVLSLLLTRPLPIAATENAFIVLEIEARRANAVSGWTSVVIELIRQDIVAPVFTQAYYRGAYNAESGLQFDEVISLSYGYDETVSFSLDGEFREMFTLDQRMSNSLGLVASESISNEVLQANNQVLLTVVATKPGALAARSAISIDIEKDLTDRVIMRFSQNTYTGAIGSTGLEAESIVLSLGYEPGTQFILTGEFDDYFTLTPNDANVLSLLLTRPLPIAATENAFIVLEIEARRANAVSGWTSVVIELIRQDIVAPVFTQAYYRGAYNAESGLQLDEVISLSDGYDETVSFDLDGEFREMFTLEQRGSNSLGLVASESLSNEVLQANNQVLLTVVATKPGALAARSAISIDIEKDLTDRVIMRFSQNTYTGAIGSTGLEAESIVLSLGYEPGTQFILTGEFDDYFTLTPNDANVLSLLLTRPLPIAATENAFIVLEIEARRANAVSGWTSVVIELFRQDIVAPVFTQAYYRGAYNAESGLQFDEVISLSYGYDETVSFALDGEFREMFTLDQRMSNSLGLVASESLSNEALQANNQVLLTVVATKPGALAARSAISIDIEKDLTDRVIMKFSQNTYTGAIGSTGLEAESIVLSLGYEPGTQFILTGEFDDYFILTPNDANVLSLLLTRPLPIAATENAFIVLEIEARRANAVSGWTSVVIELIRQVIVAPVFTQAYYRGAYNAESGLQFDEVISLSDGYDETVSFALDGEFREMFTLEQRGSNSLGLVASESLSNDVLQANNQVLLTVVATKPGTLAARSAISIDIEKDLTDRVIMRFSQNTYTGSIGSTGLEAESIVLSSGYEPGTQFILTGEFDDYFTLTPNDANVLSLLLTRPLPIAATENAFILLEVEARRANAVSGWTSVVIEVIRQDIVAPVFTQAYYRGAYNAESGLQFDEVISLSYGYDETVSFALDGEFREMFILEQRGSNSLGLVASESLSHEVLQANNQVLLTVVATKPGALVARSVISIDIEKDLTDRVIMRFSQNTYTGAIGSTGLEAESIVLSLGYEPGTQFILTGEFDDYFTLTPNDANVLSLLLTRPLPIAATENAFILLEVEARRANAVSGWTSVVIEVIRQDIVAPVFTQAYYRGAYNAESGLQFDEVISLSYGYDETVSFALDGEFREMFILEQRGSNSLGLVASESLSHEVLQANNQVLLTVVATKPGALVARSVISIDIEKDLTDRVIMRFSQNTYTGAIGSTGLEAESIVLSLGYEPGTQFILTGEFDDYFTLTPNDANVLSLLLTRPLPIAATENAFIVLEVEARRANAVSGWTSVVIELFRQDIVAPVFTQAYYRGAYNAESGLQFDEVISLSDGYDETVSFALDGEFREMFTLEQRGSNSLGLVASGSLSHEVLQANNQVLLTVVATKPGALAARSAISIDIEKDSEAGHDVSFGRYLYRGVIDQEMNEVRHEPMTITGFDGTSVDIMGDYEDLFDSHVSGGEVEVMTRAPLDLPAGVTTIGLELRAGRAGTALLLRILEPEESIDPTEPTNSTEPTDPTVSTEPTDSTEPTEPIETTESIETTEPTEPTEPTESIEPTGPTEPTRPSDPTDPTDSTDPTDLTEPTEPTEPSGPTEPIDPTNPTVTFSSESYVMSVDMAQTGLVGRVSATADNGEDVTYALGTDDAHLQTRLSINNEGELYLSAPTNSGVYTFQVIATTVYTRTTGTAMVHLTVQAVMVCDDRGIVMDPLIILDRDEEESHNNLVVLDSTQHAGCHLTLTNRWPTDQTWLYVDETGLHTIPIDREHPSIAFMPLSQVQVELILHCEGDITHRQKRSERTLRLGDYGNNKWILTDTIVYDSRRSLVNLIVNDINDNNPIFVGKENEPIAVGYPTNELEGRILPRSLAELQATDADIGENAALRYWSSESVLAVAPTTGFVHVRTGAQLAHNQVLTVTATDQNGQGRSGTIQLVVKLLDLDHIAVVTIRDAFLDDETTLLTQLSDAVGYEVKTLRSVVISDDIDEDTSRNKRETGTLRASLQFYVYGINQGEPVAVDRLAEDISTNSAITSVVSTIPLEDHLQDMNILDRQIGLLVATIILSILLFAVILLVAIWFFLRWRKNNNYDEFSDERSIASRNASLGELPKPEVVKPRLNIEDLKKSEKRLQEMLQVPIEAVTVEPMKKRTEAPVEAILDLPIPEPSAPIVIQSIDKLKDAEEFSDDEFGEVSSKPRKSVVTFNENVEKIIHVEDNVDYEDGDIYDVASVTVNVDASNDGLEIYRF